MSVQPASAAIKRLGDGLAWTVVVEDEITTDTFCRMMITRDLDAARVAIDLAVDVSPRRATTRTFVGPVYAAREAAARKLLALLDRAEARDFVDVHTLAQQGRLPDMIAEAPTIDLGFDLGQLALAVNQLTRKPDDDLPMPASEILAMRRWYGEWYESLSAGSPTPPGIRPTPPVMQWRSGDARDLPARSPEPPALGL